MTLRKTLALGGGLGLVPPVIVLALLWRYGVFEIMLGSIDLRAVLWPSSVMLTTRWCCTVPGVLITISSVGINCVIYMVVALLLRAGIGSLRSRRT
jgi:hypothetical protein